MSEYWTTTNFMVDSSLGLDPLKPSELPSLMSVLELGSEYALYKNMHAWYVGVKASSLLLAPSRDSIANQLIGKTIRDCYQRVGWNKAGLECWVETENADKTYKNSQVLNVSDVPSFIQHIITADAADEIVIEPIPVDDNPTTQLRISPIIRVLAVAVTGIEGWGLDKIPLNTASDLAAIFSAGLVNLVEEGTITEDQMTSFLGKLDGSNSNLYMRALENHVLPEMGVKTL